MDNFLIILLVIAMTIAVIEDLKYQKIPNLVTFPTMAIAVAYYSLINGHEGFLFSFSGLILGIVFFIVPYIMGGMGAGDVKLMGVTGAIFGPKGIIIASIMVILIGGIYGLIIMVTTPGYMKSFLKRYWSSLKTFVMTRQIILIPPTNEENRPVLKFAIPIAMGALCYMYIAMTGYGSVTELFGFKFQTFSISKL